MFTNNTHSKIILTIILFLYYSCHLSTALATNEVNKHKAPTPEAGRKLIRLQLPDEEVRLLVPEELSDEEVRLLVPEVLQMLSKKFNKSSSTEKAAPVQGSSRAQPKIPTVTASSEGSGKEQSGSTTLLLPQQQQIIDLQNRPEVIKVQKKLQIARAPISSQTYTVQNIAAIQSSIASNITNTRMNINQHDISTSEVENKPVAAGSQTIGRYIKPKSWDIWVSGHVGNINQGATNAILANSQTDFYGGTIGIDKIFTNNSIVGLALSYGKSNVAHISKTSTDTTSADFAVNEKWASNYYQADVYVHHNFTDNLFLKLIAGIGTYGDGTTIGNMFDFSSQKSTFGHHSNATIGYSIFGRGGSNFAITPELGIAYYHLNIPDLIFMKAGGSTFTTLNRFDSIAGLNIKIFATSRPNIKIIPEITAAVKLRLSDNVEGINANNIKLPVVRSANSNDLSANALATPEQLFTLGGALTVANNNFSIIIHGSLDFAEQYLAWIGGISIKLSF